MTKRDPNALSVKMEDALIALVRQKTLLVGSTCKGSIATIQADALVKRGLAKAGDSRPVKGTYSTYLDASSASTVAPTVVPTEDGVAMANKVLAARGGV